METTIIKAVGKAKYLGVVIQGGMKFECQCDQFVEKVKEAYVKLVGYAKANKKIR